MNRRQRIAAVVAGAVILAAVAGVAVASMYSQASRQIDNFALTGKCRDLATALNRPTDSADRLLATRDICMKIFGGDP